MIELENYRVSFEGFCIVCESKLATPIVISVPHDALAGPDFEGLFDAREKGGRDTYVWPIVKDVMLKCPVHVVRGLMPRRFVEYNTGWPIAENYYPLSQKAERVALIDERLAGCHAFFHTSIQCLLEKAIKVNGRQRCLLIDMHGFGVQPEYAPDHGYDLILGTANRRTIRHGNHKNDRVVDVLLAKHFGRAGYQVFLPAETAIREIEDAMSGGYTVRHHSQEHDINAIQIEIAKRFRTSEGVELGRRLASNLASFISDLND